METKSADLMIIVTLIKFFYMLEIHMKQNINNLIKNVEKWS